jgi:hypothetical protein
MSSELGAGRGEPLDRRMLMSLRVAVVVTFLASVTGLLPDPVGETAGWVAVGVVVAMPLARVAWLGSMWVRRRDLRFAATTAALLLVVAIGSLIAALGGDVA